MKTNAHVSLLGNLVKDPVLRQSNQRSVCNFTVAVNTDKKTESGDSIANFYDCSVWGRYGESVFRRIQKGTEVLIHGMLEHVTLKNDDGTERHYLTVDVDNVYATRGLRERADHQDDAPAVETTPAPETQDDTE